MTAITQSLLIQLILKAVFLQAIVLIKDQTQFLTKT